jgi:hypothetical protein
MMRDATFPRVSSPAKRMIQYPPRFDGSGAPSWCQGYWMPAFAGRDTAEAGAKINFLRVA